MAGMMPEQDAGAARERARRVRCSSVERVLAFVHDELDGDGMVTAFVRCEGVLAPDRLRTALDRLQARHAKLRAGLERAGNGWPCFVIPPHAPPIPLEYRMASGDNEWQRSFLQDRPGAFGKGDIPLIRFLALAHPGASVTDLVCFCHHSVCDARSMWIVCVELLRFYADERWTTSLAPEGLGLSVPKTGTRLGRWWQLMRLIRAGIREQRRHPVQFPADEDLPPGAMERHIFSEEDTQALVSACRRENVTVFSALGTAVLFAIAQEYQWDGLDIAFHAPLNVRDQFVPQPPEPDTLGTFVTTLRTVVRLPCQDEPFWDAARRLRETWNRNVRALDPVKVLGLIDLLPLRRAFVARRSSVVAINSLGRMEQPAPCGEPRILDFTWAGRAAISGSPFTVYAATVAGRFNFTIRSERQKPARVARMCREVHGRLSAAAR